MSEATQNTPEESTPVEQPQEITFNPEQVGDDVLEDLILPERAVEQPREEVAPQQEAQPEAAANPWDERFGRLEGAVHMLAQNMQAQQQQPQPGQPEQTQEAQGFMEKNKELDPASLKWFKDSFDDLNGPVQQQLEQRLAKLDNGLSRIEQREALGQFNETIEALMTNANIPVDDVFTRRAMRHTVTNEALQKHGDGLNLGHVRATFRDVNNERLKGKHVVDSEYVKTKQREESAEPPIAGGQSSASAAESLMKELKNPKNKKMDFRGDHFSQVVDRALDATSRVVDQVMGSRTRR